MKNKLLEAFNDMKPSIKSTPSEYSKPMDIGMTMSKDCSGFISMLFKAKEDAHITHIEQRSRALAPHEALSIFYTEADIFRQQSGLFL